MENIKAKALSLPVSDVDPSTRKVVGYLSKFDNVDSDRDMLTKGSFLKSISERGPKSNGNRKIAHLWMHDVREPIGKFLELNEDSFGLRFVTQMGRGTKANDIFLNYQDGIIREHSIGYFFSPNDVEKKNDNMLGNYNLVKSVDLYEGSTVTFGSNSFTEVLSVAKSLDLHSQIKLVHDELQNLFNISKNGDGTDERFMDLELGIKIVQAKYDELFNSLSKNSDISTTINKEIETETVKDSHSKSFFLNFFTKK